MVVREQAEFVHALYSTVRHFIARVYRLRVSSRIAASMPLSVSGNMRS